MRRRHFLTLTAAIAATPLLTQCHRDRQGTPAPVILTSQAGQLTVDLTAAPAQITLGQRSAALLAYNQQVPGPRLEARPGDRVEIRFHNGLTEPTNLHFHGLHLPPSGDADNPFRRVAPGETATYAFTIPENHPAGTFWYHPHHHGHVAAQVFAGLAGLFVVRGDLDEIPEIQAAEEAFLVLQDFDLDKQGQIRQPAPAFRMWGREGRVVTVNGQPTPTFSLPETGLLRLRFLNASPSQPYWLQLAEHPWYLIATDGGSLAQPVPVTTLLLSPGERAELLVPGNQPPGTYRIHAQPYDRGIEALLKTLPQARGSRPPATAQPVAIADLRYQPATPSGALPSGALPQILLPVETLPAPSITREWILDHGIDARTGQPFLINGKAFDPERTDVQVRVGTVEDWFIVNRAGLDHSFHLHTNPFQVISRNGEPEPFRAWKDVINLKAYETVQIRIPFRDYRGKTVFHCHVLDHEDQGMMGIVEMLPA